MRRRIEALADRLDEFVSEDAHDALVLDLRGDGASGVVGAALDLLEQRGSIDVSIPFFDEFRGRAPFEVALRDFVDAFAAEAGLDMALPPPGPASGTRALDALVAFAAAVRARGDVRVAVWLCPVAIADGPGYLDAALALIGAARRTDPPLRIAVSEAGGEPSLCAQLRRSALPMLQECVDVSSAAVRDALAEEAADPANDPDVRAAALLSVAMADAAAGRGAEALSVLATLADGFEARGDSASRALCFVLIGNALAALGDLAEARARVSQGLALAVEAGATGVVLGGAMLAGHLSMQAGDAADADVRFDVAARLGARVGAPLVVTEALLARGRALEKRGLAGQARDAWRCAAEAARRAASGAHERRALSELARALREEAAWAELAPIDRRLADLDAGFEYDGCQHTHEPPS